MGAEMMRDFLERALAIFKREYGPDHREIAPALTNLGNAYGTLGDAEKMRDFLERALAIFEREYGPDDREVAIILTNLGGAYGALGDAEKARDFLERALAIFEREYGHDHRFTKTTRQHLELNFPCVHNARSSWIINIVRTIFTKSMSEEFSSQ